MTVDQALNSALYTQSQRLFPTTLHKCPYQANLQMRQPRYTEVKQLAKGHVAKKKSSLWFNSNRRFFASVLCNFLTLTTGQHTHQDNLLCSPFHAAMIFVVVFMWNESRMGKPFINVCPSPSEAISSQEQPPSRWTQPYYMIDFPCSLSSCRLRIYQRVGWHGQSWPLWCRRKQVRTSETVSVRWSTNDTLRTEAMERGGEKPEGSGIRPQLTSCSGRNRSCPVTTVSQRSHTVRAQHSVPTR